jgi:hypothetical protein
MGYFAVAALARFTGLRNRCGLTGTEFELRLSSLGPLSITPFRLAKRSRQAGLRRQTILVIVTLIVCSLIAQAREIKVGLNSQFITIQAAVDSISTANKERVVVLVSNGVYSGQVRINNSFVTLRGEDRKKTRITASVDTSSCQVPPDQSKEEHCSVIVADGQHLVFENFTVENSFHSIRGKGAALSAVNDSTHILVHNVDVIGYGGDTFVLSARRNRTGNGGEYYVNDVYVSGTYHIIVPRGATYVVNSSFWCLGGEKNCLFAEGVTRETDKLVIRDSTIDGPEPFGLGSYFRDSAWYFVSDTFGGNLMPDGRIHREPAKNYVMKWGEDRIYFAGSRGPDYPWLTDNFQQSPAKTPGTVTAQWVFPEWNPENSVGPKVRSQTTSSGEIAIVFSEAVTVDGEPRLILSSGFARYISGSGSDTLRFQTSKNYHPIRLELNGGAIFASAASLHQRNADLTLSPQHQLK